MSDYEFIELLKKLVKNNTVHGPVYYGPQQ